MSLKSGIAIADELGLTRGLPTSVAGRMQALCDLYRGPPVFDQDGEPTGEYGPPLISREMFLRLMENP